MMPDYTPSGLGQGHVIHFYILGPGHIFGADEARHFEFERRVLTLHMLKFCSMGGAFSVT